MQCFYLHDDGCKYIIPMSSEVLELPIKNIITCYDKLIPIVYNNSE